MRGGAKVGGDSRVSVVAWSRQASGGSGFRTRAH